MKLLLAILVLLSHAAVFAQAPDPALIQLVEKHDAEVKTLSQKRDSAIKREREAYIVALNDAEATSRTAGRTVEVDAIEAERAAFEKHTFTATNTALPPRVMPLRAKYLSAYAVAQRQFQPPIDVLNAAFLRDLGTFDANARKAGNDALVKQVAAAKAKHLGLPVDDKKKADNAKTNVKADAAPKPPAPAPTPGSVKSLVPNGDFSGRDPVEREHAAGWKYTSGNAISLVTENGNSFIRLDSTARPPGGFNQKMALPEKVGRLKISLRARISQLEINKDENGKPKGRPSFYGWVQDAAGANLKGFIIHLDRVTTRWETFDTTCSVPEGGTQLSLTGELMKSKAVVDIDDVQIVPAD